MQVLFAMAIVSVRAILLRVDVAAHVARLGALDEALLPDAPGVSSSLTEAL